MARENPVEDKHRRLVRSHRSGPLDRELKPNAHDRDALTVRLMSILIERARLISDDTIDYPQLSSIAPVDGER